MNDPKLKILSDMLNDNVQCVENRLYKWRDMYYEVLPYALIEKRQNWSQFAIVGYRGKKYGFREASERIIKKYYLNSYKLLRK